jgi:S1-C subfamily serine protease
MNVASLSLSKSQTMRILFALITLTLAASLSAPAATPELAPSPTIPAAAAEAGKDVVHQLNNAFAKVFEIVAPSVVVIEVSKKTDVSDNSGFDDLFFQGPPDESNPRRNPRGGMQPIQRWSAQMRRPTLR